MRYFVAVFISLISVQASADNLNTVISELKKYTNIYVDSPKCESIGNLDGAYFPTSNKIILCATKMEHHWPKHRIVNAKLQTLLHEAVHLAQDCAAGVNNEDMIVIDKTRNVKSSLLKIIRNGYKKKHHDIEIEAWSYWNKAGVLDLVRKYCISINNP